MCSYLNKFNIVFALLFASAITICTPAPISSLQRTIDLEKQEGQLSKKVQDDQIKQVIKDLKSTNPNTRISAVNMLAIMVQDISPAIPLLFNLLGDETPTEMTVKESQQGCPDCGTFSPEKFLTKKMPLGDRVAELLICHKTDVVPEFEKKLSDTNANIRRRAVCALSQLKADVPLPKVLPLGKDDDVQTRKCVINVLGNSSDTVSAVQHIAHFARKDNDNYVRFAAIRKLGELHDTRSLPIVIELLKDPNRGIVLETIEALSQFPDKDALIALKEITKHKDKIIQTKAIEAIEKIHHKK